MGLFDQFRGSRGTAAILPTDTVVFIVGPTGSGKSWFMSALLKNANVHVQVGGRQRLGTTEVHAERCQFDGMESDIVIVDTPSFHTFTRRDGEKVVRKWMESNHTKPCKWAGMLYMHNLAFNPYDGNLRMSKHLDAFRRAYHPNPFPRVIHVVPTSSIGAKLAKERVRILTDQLQCQAEAVGALMHNTFDGKLFDGNPETAWDIVQGLLSGAESSATKPHIVSSHPQSELDNWPVPGSWSRQANDEPGAQPKKPLEAAENDYVIFVVGPTGAGKTWFTTQLSKSRYVARGGQPGTKSVEAWKFQLGNGPVNVIVVDTPSFHTGRDNVHAENTMTEWLEFNFRKKCHSGILFLHPLDSDPTCDEMMMSRHLETFAKVFPSKFKVPSRVYVVPADNSNSTLPSEKQGQRLSQLNAIMEALDGHGNCTWHVSMFPGIFKGQPETAWSAVLLLLKDISQTEAKESILSLIGPVSKLLAPKFLNAVALKDLADILFREFRMNSRNGDLDAIITIGRTAMEVTPPEHPQHHLSLINLADLLSERSNKEGTKEDLDEVIMLRRNASECMSLGDQQRGTIHLKLDESLSQRFRSRGDLADLEEIISLRRIVSESTPVPDRYKPLLSLADSLHEKYQKLGSVDDIEEAIRLVHTASQLRPPEHPDLALSQEHLTRYLRAKISKGTVPAHVNDPGTDPSSFGSSITEHSPNAEVTENDYVIFVVGPTGAGKTWFTTQLSKSRYVARGGHPGTKNFEAWRCQLGNGPVNIIVVDTPSFHTGGDDVHAKNMITEWLVSNFRKKCHSGILFLHSLDSDPTCDEMLTSRHLETFAKAFPGEFKVPSRVYVVPTSNSNSTLPTEKLGQGLSQIHAVMEALNGHGNCTWHASVFPGIFKGQPETAWSAALLLLKDISQTQAKESMSSRDGSALKDLADLLFKEFRKSGDLDAIITFGRTAMEFTPPEHPQRYSALINLADLLSKRFNGEGSKEDLDEVITLRRDASKDMSPDDPQGLAVHLELDKSLSQRFESRGALVDLEEIISLRRVVSKSTPAPDQYKPLLGLADSLYDKYQKLGFVDDLEEALRVVHTTSQLCPIKHPGLVLSQKNLAHSLQDKVRKGLGTSG